MTRPGEAGRARDQDNLLNGSNRPPSNLECYDSCLAGGGGRRKELNVDKRGNKAGIAPNEGVMWESWFDETGLLGAGGTGVLGSDSG